MSENPELKFKHLVQRVLNEEFLIGLQGGVRLSINGKTQEFDLADQKKNYFVKIKLNSPSVNRPHVLNEVQAHIASLSTRTNKKPFKYILVFNNSISDNDREYFKSSLNIASSDFVLFDLDNINELAKKQSINILEFGISNNSDPDLLNEKTNDVLNILKLRSLFIGGYVWNNKDQSDRFLEEGIWEKYPQEYEVSSINTVKEGDLIFLRTTTISDTLRYIVIRGFGVVSENPQNGHSIKVRWSLFNGTIKIDGLESYGRNFQKIKEEDKNLLFSRVIDEIPDFIDRLHQLANDFVFQEKREIEVQIDRDSKFLIGLNIGAEITDYDIIFLPHSSYGPIGKNGIAAHILNLLGADREVFEFSEHELKEIKYKWNYTDLPDKRVEIGFVVSKGEDKNEFNFRENLKEAIYNFQGPIIKEGKVNPPIKVFIPLLGTGQAGMSYEDSFEIIKDIIPLIQNEFRNPQIRLNFPREIHQFKLNSFIKILAKELNLTLTNGFEGDITKLYKDNIPQKNVKNENDKIPFHLDQVVNEDKLGREPVAKAFVDLIKKDIFTDKLNHSFMVHLQGKWGVGKSSFLNFIKKNLNSDEETWIIVEYNAWQNQHILPPWWSLIDQVYLKSRRQLYLIGIRTSLHLWRKEIFRRIWSYSGGKKIITFIMFIICVTLLILFREEIANLFSESHPSPGDVLKSLVAFISVLVSIYTFARFITIPFFINSSEEAKSFVLHASDPMNKIRNHFNNLVDNINSKKKKRQLAIFIDDIDRCDGKFIVQLLEGIQTLFKDKKVLYVIAGDKNWISTSFGNTYKDFVTEETDKNQLGDFFIEKAFQLSFRLPNISEESKQNYWDHIIGIKSKDSTKKITSIKELSEEKQEEIKNLLKESRSQLTNPNFVQEVQIQYNLTGDTASNLVIEEKNKDTEKLKHLLQDYHRYIDTNPRSIIRLANNYTMARSVLMAERVEFSEQTLFRWLVIEDLCPRVKEEASNAENISKIKEIINSTEEIIKRNNCLKLLNGEGEFMEDEISIKEIKTIKGL
tara:strand:+ start:4552 stop:7635 length:3084 start_codon:yes stop_codon:yes gene_type:complete